MRQIITVSEQYTAQRLDNYLIRELKGVPKSLIYRFLRVKQIKVNRKRAKPDLRVQPGDEISFPEYLRSHNQPVLPKEKMQHYFADLKQHILADSKTHLVINKPHGLACHGGSGVSASLIDIVRSEYPAAQLAHRLDKDTSGCVVLPKNRQALLQLNELIRTREVDKYYFCVVEGVWPKHLQKITLPLKRIHTKQGDKRIVVDHSEGQEACTLVKRVSCNKRYSLLAIKLITGRTHQIRVHCASSGHPIVGDEKYGDLQQQTRLFLHASVLHFEDKTFIAGMDKHFKLFCEQEQLIAKAHAADYF